MSSGGEYAYKGGTKDVVYTPNKDEQIRALALELRKQRDINQKLIANSQEMSRRLKIAERRLKLIEKVLILDPNKSAVDQIKEEINVKQTSGTS